MKTLRRLGRLLVLSQAQAAWAASSYDFALIADNSVFSSGFGTRPPAVNDHGHVAFGASGTPTFSGVFVAHGPGTSLSDYILIADGTTAVGSINDSGDVSFQKGFDTLRGSGGSTTTLFTRGTFSQFTGGAPSINNAGHAAMLVTGGVAFNLVRLDGAASTILYKKGSAYPDFDTFFAAAPDINDGGVVAFNARQRPQMVGGSTPQAMFVGSGGTATLVDSIQSGSGQSYDFNAGISLNNSGQLAFVKTFSGGGVEKIMVGDSEFASTSSGGFVDFEAIALNDDGDVAFKARFNDGGVFRRGIFTGPDPVADRVIAEGDDLFGAAVGSSLEFASVGFSDAGHIAFRANRSAGGPVVALATPVQPPTEYRWANLAGGAFTEPANWSQSAVPGEFHTAIFNAGGSYGVDLPGSGHTVGRLDINADTVAINLGKLRIGSDGTSGSPAFELRASLGMTIRNGGKLLTESAFIGGSLEPVVILGAGSSLGTASAPVGILQIGTTSAGVIEANEGGAIYAIAAKLAAGAGSSANVTLNGGNLGTNSSKFVASFSLAVGDVGNATLRLEQGAMLITPDLSVGKEPGSTGLLVLNGAATRLAPLFSGNFIEVGARGTGILRVEDGAVVDYFSASDLSEGLRIGSGPAGNGTVSVAGQGSVLYFVGEFPSSDPRVLLMSGTGAGKGTLDLSGKAKATFGMGKVAQNASAPAGGGPAGLIRVDDASLEFTFRISDDPFEELAGGIGLFIGNRGELKIVNGGLVTSRTSGLGGAGFGQALADIEGAGSKWKASALFMAGEFAPAAKVRAGGELSADLLVMNRGKIEVSSGGKLVTKDARIGSFLTDDQPLGTGVILSDAGSTWTTDTLIVGTDDAPEIVGIVQIGSGAAVTAGSVIVKTGGKIMGTGTINGMVANNATFAPGNSPGVLTINGSYTQGATGVLEVEIGGNAPGQQYDQLVINGAATLGGKLKLQFVDGFLPVSGDQFEFLSAATMSGAFTDVEVVGAAPEFEYDVTNAGGALRFEAINEAGLADVQGGGQVRKQGKLDGVRAAILKGRGTNPPGGVASGKWNGTSGITSSTAAQAFLDNNTETLSIGYALNSELLTSYTTFLAQPVSDSDILIRLTRNGDANLDGVVNNNDITILAGFYRPGVVGRHWYQADFNYDGEVNNNDITILAGFYAPSAPPLPNAGAWQLTTGNSISVPEPTLCLLLPLAALITRRRR